MNTINLKAWHYGVGGLLLGALITALVLYAFSPGPAPAHDHAAPAATANEEIWTCSMHPQIRQSEAGDCAICGMDLIPLAENASTDPLVLEMTEDAIRLANIQTTIVGGGDVGEQPSMRLSGRVAADERLAASLTAHVPGRIEKLYVTFTGEPVRKGQRLAEVYAPELIAAQRELLEAVRLRDIQPELVTAARNKLRYWKIPEATITELEATGTIRETFPVYAETGGVVRERHIAVGDYLRRGEPLFTIVNLSRVWVLFDAYEEDLTRLRQGDRIEFTTPALPGQAFTAKVTFVDPVVDPKTRTVALRTEVDNRSGLLKPEMLVYGKLLSTEAGTTTPRVPKSAVLWTGPRSVVYVKLPDTTVPSFQYREVELGEAAGGYYTVTSGLAAGEEIVTYGSFAIDAAAQLNNQASMINQEVDRKTDASVVEVLPDYRTETPEALRAQLGGVVESYFAVKDALVATDADRARAAATELTDQITTLNGEALPAEAGAYWRERYEALAAHAAGIVEAEDVEAQRRQFDFLSQALIHVVKVFGADAPTLYVQHCPMAFDDAGADWLSAEEKILNPYFGDVMLRCGLVEETISSTD